MHPVVCVKSMVCAFTKSIFQYLNHREHFSKIRKISNSCSLLLFHFSPAPTVVNNNNTYQKTPQITENWLLISSSMFQREIFLRTKERVPHICDLWRDKRERQREQIDHEWRRMISTKLPFIKSHKYRNKWQFYGSLSLANAPTTAWVSEKRQTK